MSFRFVSLQIYSTLKSEHKMVKQMLYGLMALSVISILLGTAGAAISTTSIPTSMIVDYEATTTDLTLSDGESGVLSIIVKNTGGQSAENVKVEAYGTGSLSLSKQFYLGTVVAGESKTVSAIVNTLGQPTGGVSAVRVTIYYDGYNSNGNKVEDQSTVWEIPVKITGNSLFRVTIPQSTYFEGALNNLTFECMPIASVSDVEATLSSDCLTVIGSSKQYIAGIGAEGTADITYAIRPKSTGACETTLELSYKAGGTKSSEEIPVGLNIETSPVDFKVIKVDYGEIGPGDTAVVNLTLENDGSMTAEDASVRLSLSDPFTPVDGIEKYVGDVAPGETVSVSLGLFVSWDATTQTYSMPLEIDYKVGGVSNSQEEEVGVDVAGRVMLEVISVDSSGSSVTVQVANIGTRAADSVKATLVSQALGGQNRSSGSQGMVPGGTEAQAQVSASQQAVDYKSDIKSTKEATFTFSGSFSGTATLTLEYTGPNNQRVKQIETISLGSAISSVASSPAGFRSRGGGSSIFDTILYVAAAVILVYVGYRYHKKKKRIASGDVGDDEKKSWKNLWGRI